MVLAVYLFIAAHKICRQFGDKQKVELINMLVDFSVQGRYSIPFQQIHENPHGGLLYLKLASESVRKGGGLAVLYGLKGKLSIIEKNGNELYVSDFTAVDFYKAPHIAENDEYRFLTCYHKPLPWQSGNFTLILDIYRPASGLKNISQILIAKYNPCSLELLAAKFFNIIGTIFTVLSIIIIVFVVRRTLKIRHAGQSETCPGSVTSRQ